MNANPSGAFATSAAIRRDGRRGARRSRRLPRGGVARTRSSSAQNMSTLTLHIGRSHRGDARPGRRDRRHDARPRGERLAPGRRWPPIAASRSSRSTSARTTSRSTSRTSSRSSGRGRSSSPSGYASNAVGSVNPVTRDRRAGARGRRADLRRRRRVRAARADRRPRRSTRTSSPARRTSGSGRTSARCTARPTCSTTCRPSRSGPPTTGSRPGRRRSKSIAGTLAATDYLRDVGRVIRRRRRPRPAPAMPASAGASSSPRWSRSPTTSGSSSTRLIDGLERHRGRDHPRHHGPGAVRGQRVPTVSVSIDGVHPHEAAAEALGRQGIYAWDGDFYATGLIERARQGRDRRRPAARARPLQHRRRGRPHARGVERIAAGAR